MSNKIMSSNVVFKLCFKTVLGCQQNPNKVVCSAVLYQRMCTTTTTAVDKAASSKLSQAMKAYLERAKSHEKFMNEEQTEFEIGKRHLANIMGEDPESITQQHIDEAIEYLLPSGLFAKTARPMMKPPLEVIPPRKAAQFDIEGRPFHHLFYTGFPNFYQILFDAGKKITHLSSMEGKQYDPVPKLQLAGSHWCDKVFIEKKVNEKISDLQYGQLIKILTRLAEHPLAAVHKDFIFQFRKFLTKAAAIQTRKELLKDSQGHVYQEDQGERKRAKALVRIYEKGSGKVTINGKGMLEYFPVLLDRQQLLFPLHFTNKLGQVDVEATVSAGGHSGQAGAMRFAIAKCLQSFVDDKMIEQMRLAGLLSYDQRHRERKKPGQEGARRKFTWKKR